MAHKEASICNEELHQILPTINSGSPEGPHLHFPQNRITDHRIGLTLYNLDRVIEGDLGEMSATSIWFNGFAACGANGCLSAAAYDASAKGSFRNREAKVSDGVRRVRARILCEATEGPAPARHSCCRSVTGPGD